MHKKVNLTKILYLICAVFLCTGIVGTVFKKNGKNFKEIKTALLNPKYAAQVNRICIQNEKDKNELVLRKNEDTGMWTGEFQGKTGKKMLFPVDGRQTAALLDASRKILSMYIISDSKAQKAAKSPFFTPNDDFFSFEFLQDAQSFSHFYAKNAQKAGKTLYIGTSNRSKNEEKNKDLKKVLYAANGDLAFFLNLNPAVWADGKLFSDFIKKGQNETDVQKIVYSLYSGKNRLLIQKSLAAGDKNFSDTVSNLFSARTSKIISKPDKSFFTEGEKSYEVRVEFSNGESSRIFIYFAGDDFIVVPDCLDYALEISTWTQNRIGIGEGGILP